MGALGNGIGWLTVAPVLYVGIYTHHHTLRVAYTIPVPTESLQLFNVSHTCLNTYQLERNWLVDQHVQVVDVSPG